MSRQKIVSREMMILGSVQQLPSGNYRVRVYDYTDTNNKKHYRSFSAPTVREAEQLANMYLANRTVKVNISPYSEITLSEAYERYISSKSFILSPSTIRGYRQCQRSYFKELMNLRLCELTQEKIQLAVNSLAADKSSKTVRNAYGLLLAVLSTYLPDFTLKICLPQKTLADYTIPTSEDIKILLSKANLFIRVPIMLAAYGSLRRSEICALTEEDIKTGGITVSKAKVYDENNQLKIKPPKSRAGYRFVPLSKQVLEEVNGWKYFDCSPAKIDKEFITLVRSCDVPYFSFHKLRHFFASELHSRGIPDKEIARIGGWANVNTLQAIYEHPMRDKVNIFNSRVVEIFSSSS